MAVASCLHHILKLQNILFGKCTRHNHDTTCSYPIDALVELQMVMQAISKAMVFRHVLSMVSNKQQSTPLHISVKALLDAGPNPTDRIQSQLLMNHARWIHWYARL